MYAVADVDGYGGTDQDAAAYADGEGYGDEYAHQGGAGGVAGYRGGGPGGLATESM